MCSRRCAGVQRGHQVHVDGGSAPAARAARHSGQGEGAPGRWHHMHWSWGSGISSHQSGRASGPVQPSPSPGRTPWSASASAIGLTLCSARPLAEAVELAGAVGLGVLLGRVVGPAAGRVAGHELTTVATGSSSSAWSRRQAGRRAALSPAREGRRRAAAPRPPNWGRGRHRRSTPSGGCSRRARRRSAGRELAGRRPAGTPPTRPPGPSRPPRRHRPDRSHRGTPRIPWAPRSR